MTRYNPRHPIIRAKASDIGENSTNPKMILCNPAQIRERQSGGGLVTGSR